MCNLLAGRFTELAGLKCSGDPNVPCGEFAFRVPLFVESGSSDSPRSSQSFCCDCAFQCDCPKPEHGIAGVHVKRIYDGLTLVAERGFQSPTWNGGSVVELDDGSGDMLVVWKGLFSVRFRRVSDNLVDEVRPARQQMYSKPPGAVEEDSMDVA